MGEFIQNECLTDPGVRVKSSVLYGYYKDWAGESSGSIKTQREFGELMTKLGYDRVMNNGTWYQGIQLRNPPTNRNGSDLPSEFSEY